MKKNLITLLAFAMTSFAWAGESAWLQSVPKALEQAVTENKLILLDFTGSDWCGWCKKLSAETFSQQEFIDYAAKNVVLVEVDFPFHIAQPADLKEANKALKEKYDVGGYPTLVVLKSDGTQLWKHTGYLPGGPKAMIAQLNQLNPNAVQPSPVATTPSPAPAPVAIPTPAPAPIPAPVAQRGGDEPKLQAILYSSTHSSIILGGKNCEVGDWVGGMRVVKIDRNKVTVEWGGSEKELRMN